MIRDGLLAREVLLCVECGGVMEPDDVVLCADGYERVYGEFVLEATDELHESKEPIAHSVCARAAEDAAGADRDDEATAPIVTVREDEKAAASTAAEEDRLLENVRRQAPWFFSRG
jgi:hypothetical protein